MSRAVPTLRGKSVLIRPVRESDKGTYQAIAGHPDLVRAFGGNASQAGPRSAEDAERFLRSHPDSARWAIERDGAMIGTVRLHHIEEPDQRARLAIGIYQPDNWNRGFGTEAIRLALHHAFNTMHLHRVDLRVFQRNKRAIRAYEKSGFTVEGVEREAALSDGVWEDDVIMSILVHEYRTLNAQQSK